MASAQPDVNELVGWISELRVSNANEATTRLKLIDTIIFDLLGWQKEDVQVEERVSEDGKTTYLDYKVSCGPHSFIVEAKRIGRAFQHLPASRTAPLGESWAKSGEAGEAIRQARDYARIQGVGFAIATNGVSWVIFPVNRRDQVSFEESLAFIFSDLGKTLQNDRSEFVSLLGKPEVVAGKLEETLLGGERDQYEHRRLNDIYDRSFSRVSRASIFHAIEREIITAFSEELLSDNAEVLEKCYVQTPERTRFDSRIHMHLSAREQVLRSRPIRPVGRRRDRDAVKDLITETRLSTRPIALLTVGMVGAGKTTFLNYVSKVTAADQFKVCESRPQGCWIWVDFRDYSQVEEPLYFIVDKAFAYITEHPYLNDFDKSVSKAYESEIRSLKSGPLKLLVSQPETLNRAISEVIVNEYTQKLPYVKRIISNISKDVPVFLVIDNVDQIEDVDRQATIFLEGTGLARSTGCNLVLAMRDSTYVKNRSSSVFDAFDFDAVYIDAPNISAVLSKRFSIAAQLLAGKPVKFSAEKGEDVLVRDARTIVDMLSMSVLGTEVGSFIEVAATGDVRLALQMTRQFLQFGYTSTSRAVERFQRSGKYYLPMHEALRAIMLGNQNVYREDFSVFGNPFDSRLGRTDLQFLRIYLMGVFVTLSSEREFEGLSMREVLDKLETMGIAQGASRRVIADLIRFRYLFTKSHQQATDESILIPSRFCGLIVRELIGRLMFVETTMFDTFIADDTIWNTLKTNAAAIYRERDQRKRFTMRKAMVRTFFDYCERSAEPLVERARKLGLETSWTGNPLTRIKDAFKGDLQKATRSMKRSTRENKLEGRQLFDTGNR